VAREEGEGGRRVRIERAAGGGSGQLGRLAGVLGEAAGGLGVHERGVVLVAGDGGAGVRGLAVHDVLIGAGLLLLGRAGGEHDERERKAEERKGEDATEHVHL
jgi:hypothetical protein